MIKFSGENEKSVYADESVESSRCSGIMQYSPHIIHAVNHVLIRLMLID